MKLPFISSRRQSSKEGDINDNHTSSRHGHDNLGATVDTRTNPPTSPAVEAIVTFTLQAGQNEQGKNTSKHEASKPIRADYSKLLSIAYATLLILIGLLFPMTEALSTASYPSQWLNTTYNMIYIVYTLSISTVCVIYLQWLLVHVSRLHKHGNHDEHDGGGNHSDEQEPGTPPVRSPSRRQSGVAVVRQTSHGILIQDAAEPLQKKKASTSSAYMNGSATHYTKGGSGVAGTRMANGGVSARIRLGSTPNLQEAVDGDSSPLSEDIPPETDATEVWMDLSKLGSVFSHEGSNLYLRLWELIFALGNVIYIAIEIQYQLSPDTDECTGQYGWTFIFRLVFLLFQTFFLFKNPTMHTQKHEGIVRFALMHLIATNMSVWLRTLINEIMNEYSHLSHTTESSVGSQVSETTTTDNKTKCQEYADIVKATSPYLFPFVLEYSLIAIGALAVMFSAVDEFDSGEQENALRGIQNLFRVQALEKSSVSSKDKSKTTTDAEDEGEHSHLLPLLSKSHRGFYVGILALSGCFIAILLFYFNVDKQAHIYLITDICLHSLMLVATVIAGYNLHKLSYIARPLSVDDILLMLTVSGAVFYEISLMMTAGVNISAINSQSPITDTGENVTVHAAAAAEVSALASESSTTTTTTTDITTESLRLSSSMISAVQGILQVLLTISGLRRYPSKRSHLENMPGRGTVTFLIVANVSVWICRTAMVKVIPPTQMTDYYGVMAWLLIVNINLPLLLFFRFHSSVCLADVWHSAYTSPLESNHEGPTSGSGSGGAEAVSSPAALTVANDERTAKSVGVSTLLKSYSMSHLPTSPSIGGGSSAADRSWATVQDYGRISSSSYRGRLPHIEDVEDVEEVFEDTKNDTAVMDLARF